MSVYHIVIAVDDSPISKKAIDYGINLCKNLATQYQLEILYAVGLNPTGITKFGLLSGLDRLNNIDIQQDAKESVNNLKSYLTKYNETTDLIVKESTKDVGSIIEEYVNQNPPDMLIMGSSNKEGLQKFILGSVSDYCLHKCKCPITIIK